MRFDFRKKVPPYVHLTNSIFTLTDPQKDMDDSLTMVSCGYQTLVGAVELIGAVACLAPVEYRESYLRANYDLLGLNNVPTAIGSTCGSNEVYNARSYQWSAKYVENYLNRSREASLDLMFRQCQNAKNKSITWLIIAGMTDLAQFMKNYPNLFKEKTKEVVIMGGVLAENDEVKLENGLMIPDDSANNKFDVEASRCVYGTLQEWNIKMIIVSRFAAYQAPRSASFYDEIASTCHPIGVSLRKMQKLSLNHLWFRSNLEPNDDRREKLPGRCDRKWFLETFTYLTEVNLTGEDEIWQHVTKIYLYDVVASLAATRDRYIYFEPDEISVRGTKHYVIGVSNNRHNVRYPEALAGRMQDLILRGLHIYAEAGGYRFQKAVNF